MRSSKLYGASEPLVGDGTIPFPGGSGIFPGTLWAWIPAHAAHGIRGATVNGAFVPENAAWRQCADLIGCTEAEARYGKTVVGSDIGPTKMKIEETDSGVHFIVSQSVDTSNTRIMICAPDKVKQWMIDHGYAGLGVTSTDAANVANGPNRHCIGSFMSIRPTRLYRTDSGKVGNTAAIAGIGNPAGSVNTMGLIQGSANSVNYVVSGVENTGLALTAPAATTNADIGNLMYPAGAPVLNAPQMRFTAARHWHSAVPASVNDFEVGVGAGHLFGQIASGFMGACMSYELRNFSIIDLAIETGYGDFQGFGNRNSIDRALDYGDIFQVRNVLMAEHDRANAIGGEYYGTTIPTAPGTIP